MTKTTRLDQALITLNRFYDDHEYGPSVTELETFAQVRSRTLGRRLSEAVKAGLVYSSQGRYRCLVSGRKAHRWWLTLDGRARVAALIA